MAINHLGMAEYQHGAPLSLLVFTFHLINDDILVESTFTSKERATTIFVTTFQILSANNSENKMNWLSVGGKAL